MTQFEKLQNLKEQITTAREELNSLWAAHGCTNAIVLAAATKLDELCNEYERLIRGKDSLRGTR